MSVMEDMTNVLANIPELKSSADCINELERYCEDPEDVAALFSLPFPQEIVDDLATACREENRDKNMVLIHQVWQAVLQLPNAKVPINIRRRKLQ